MNVTFGTSCSFKSALARVFCLALIINIKFILAHHENQIQRVLRLLVLQKVLKWHDTRGQARKKGHKFFGPHMQPICADLLQEKGG